MEILIFWLAFSFIAYFIAKKKGLKAWQFFAVALLLSPIIGIIAALVSKPNVAELERQQMVSGEMKKCPHCAEMIKREAKVCKFCGKEMPVAAAS